MQGVCAVAGHAAAAALGRARAQRPGASGAASQCATLKAPASLRSILRNQNPIYRCLGQAGGAQARICGPRAEARAPTSAPRTPLEGASFLLASSIILEAAFQLLRRSPAERAKQITGELRMRVAPYVEVLGP
jgi:hypothetical protein